MKAFLIAISLLFVSASASAACNKASAAGKWETFMNTVDTTSGWKSCTLLVSVGGIVNAGSSTCITDTGASEAVQGGTLNAANNCALTGNVTINNITYTLSDGQISRNKFNSSGVGTYSGGIFSFNAIKQ